MDHFVYILQSETTQRYYVGESADVSNRLYRHNSKSTTSTRHGVPWKVVHVVTCVDRTAALLLEKKIKGRGIGRWLREQAESAG
jgi:putative endonuclease